MYFPLGCEKLLTHISLFLDKALPKDVMSFYSIYCSLYQKRGERAHFWVSDLCQE